MKQLFALLVVIAFSQISLGQIQIGQDIDGEAFGDQSGRSLSLSADGSRVAIGAKNNDGNGTDAGHVRIYEYVNNSWTQLGADIDGEAAGDWSGYSVSLSADGSIVAIGAPENNGSGSQAGHVRIYEYSGGSWTQLGADIDGEAALDYSGYSVSLSADGSTVAIGAPRNDGNGTDAGHVRIYEYANGSWTQQGSDIDGEAAGDWSGFSVSLSENGDTVAIGARQNDGNGSNSGHVRIYEYSGGSWTQLGADIDGEAAGDQSGISVSLSADGSIVAVGAYLNDGNGSNSGHVRIFEYLGGSWTQLGSDIDGEAAGDHSGWSISLSADGSRVAIGAEYNDGNGPYAGHVRIYDYMNGSWILQTDIDAEAADDLLGRGVSLSADGDTVAIGAPNNDGNGSNSGHVRVFNINNCGIIFTDQITACYSYTWIDGVTYTASTNTPQVIFTAANGCDSIVSLDLTINSSILPQIDQEIDGEAAGDESGWSVSLSADGSRVAIGAYRNDGYGTDAGHVRIYEYSGGSWTQLGADIDGEAIGDWSGVSVSLSADGSRVAIGAERNVGNGTDAGHVRIYEYMNGSWTQLGSDIDGEAAGDRLGRSVSLSADGSRVAIGAQFNDGNGTFAGHVRIYEYMNGSWTQLGSDIDGEAAGDRLGRSVSLSADGSRVAIGAHRNDGYGTDAGHVRIYEYSGGSWTQLGADIDGEAAGDWSGFSVSLSADGSIVAIGAPENNGSGSQAGHVRIYEYMNGSWTQLGSDIDGEAALDQSGWSISLSADGSKVAIGAKYNAGNGTDAGHVRIYEYMNGSWTQLESDIDGEAAGDLSGWSVSLSADGSRVAIGAPNNDDNGNDAGHTRVYKLSYTDHITACNSYTWIDGVTYTASTNTPQVIFTAANGCDSIVSLDLTINSSILPQIEQEIDGEAAGDLSGISVSLSADDSIVAIGAPYNDDNGNDAGHVRIYKNMNGSLIQLGGDIDGEAALDYSGYSVSLSADGSRVAIGAPNNDDNGNDAGHVRIYEYSSGSWAQLGADIDGDTALDQSGWPISLSADGSRVAIGAPRNDGYGTDAGHVRIYEYSGGSWTQLGADIDGEAAGDWSGFSVSLSADGSRVAIGAERNDGNGTDAGHVRIYEYMNGSWTQMGSDIEGEAAGDRLGRSVSLSADGSRVAIGAERNDGNGTDAGHVRIYEYMNGSWTQMGSDIEGEAALDYSGYSVSLSADGGTVAIGAPFNDGNGTDAGHVRIYEYMNGSWTQMGSDIEGEAAGDLSGFSVSLSADGSTVAIGTPFNDGGGNNAGHTRVYKLSYTNHITACNSYTWIDGVTYSASTTSPQVTLTAANGCDSIVTLDLTINNSVTGTDQITSCSSYTWIDGVTYSASTTSPQVTLTAANGCDSIVTLNLNIQETIFDTISVTVCSSYTSPGGQVLSTSGQYTDTISSSLGCDSVITVNLIVQDYQPEICMITTDSLTGQFNIVVWEKPLEKAFIDSFFIARAVGSGNFQTIGGQHRDSLSVFYDYTGNPNNGSYMYRIAIRDTCGDLRAFSGYHKALHLEHLGSGSFQWSSYEIEGLITPVSSYDFYRDNFGTGNFQLLTSLPGNDTTYLDIDFSLYPNAAYRVEVNFVSGYICAPSQMTDYLPNKAFNPVYRKAFSNIISFALTSLPEKDIEAFVYPNPTSGNIKVILPEAQGVIRVYDVRGKMLEKILVNQKEMQVSLGSYANGVYLIQIEQNGMKTARRVTLSK